LWALKKLTLTYCPFIVRKIHPTARFLSIDLFQKRTVKYFSISDTFLAPRKMNIANNLTRLDPIIKELLTFLIRINCRVNLYSANRIWNWGEIWLIKYLMGKSLPFCSFICVLRDGNELDVAYVGHWMMYVVCCVYVCCMLLSNHYQQLILKLSSEFSLLFSFYFS